MIKIGSTAVHVNTLTASEYFARKIARYTAAKVFCSSFDITVLERNMRISFITSNGILIEAQLHQDINCKDIYIHELEHNQFVVLLPHFKHWPEVQVGLTKNDDWINSAIEIIENPSINTLGIIHSGSFTMEKLAKILHQDVDSLRQEIQKTIDNSSGPESILMEHAIDKCNDDPSEWKVNWHLYAASRLADEICLSDSTYID